MARIPDNVQLIPSILDRLTDTEPNLDIERPENATQVLNRLRKSVLDDLRNLLSTRRRCTRIPSDLSELKKSLVSYGVRDFTGHSFASTTDVGGKEHERQMSDRDVLRREVETAIRLFEPRFKSVSVRLLENTVREDRTVRFQIDAVLHAHPAPVKVTYDSKIDPSNSYVDVKEQSA